MGLAAVVVVVVGGLVLTGCAEEPSGIEANGDPAEQSSEETMASGEGVDLGPGATYQEQIDELEKVVSVMEERVGSDQVLRDGRTDTWTPEHHIENRRPNAACQGEDSFRNRVIFDYAGLDAEQALAAGYEMAEDMGLTPNKAINRDGTSQGQMKFVASGDGGRGLEIRQQAGDESIIEVFYNTPCSNHESLQQAYDRIVGESREERREERQREREELRDEIRSE